MYTLMKWIIICVALVSVFACPAGLLKWDPAVLRGRLDNGLHYYIRKNPKPDSRLELRLVVNAGSVLEADDQRGLAHYVEHMAFNGTRRFARQELVDYLESIGMTFGPDLNAYTSFDETVYTLQLPTDDGALVDKGVMILREWADAMAFHGEEIEKERGVILEERRLHRGAQQRIRDQHIPKIFHGSKYAERIPIGTKKVLTSFSFDRLRDFYQDWYRPDLMAIVAVGDVAPEQVLALIRKHFSSMQKSEHAPVRGTFPVPDHEETLISIATDPEATLSSGSVYYKMNEEPFKTEAHYRASLVQQAFLGMLNQRFDEIRKKPGAPFLHAHVYKSAIVRGKEFFGLGTMVKEGEYLSGMAAGLDEIERVKRFGFTGPEFDRHKRRALRGMERRHAEKEKTNSPVYAGRYVAAFLKNQVVLSIDKEWELYQRFLSEIPLAEVNALSHAWIRDDNRVVLMDGPEKAGAAPPSVDAVRAILDATARRDLEPYVDDSGDAPLVDPMPTPGKVVKRERVDELNVETWTLSNGVKLMLKPTEYKDDQVLFSAFSKGGHSLIPDPYFVSAVSAPSVIGECGLGPFSNTQLRKKLAGKIVSVAPYINEHGEGLKGTCSAADLETLFQLIYLHFTSFRHDRAAFASLQERMKAMLKNRLMSPRAAFSDTVQRTMSQHHFRREPWTPEMVDRMDMLQSIVTYKDRFSDADDFTFLFVGRFDRSELEHLAVTYLAGLPSLPTEENWVDRGVRSAPGKIDKEIRKGLEPKSTVLRMYTGSFEWNYNNRFALQSMVSALRIKLRETLREDLGGTYGVSVSPIIRHYPLGEYAVQISFSCAPEQVEQLLTELDQEILALQKTPMASSYVKKVKESHLRQRETSRETNEFWRSTLQYYHWHGEDPRIVQAFDIYVKALNAEGIMQTARESFSTPNVATFILMPERSPEPIE
jgi:zinc protease